jgi:hypothetical protein
MRIHLQLFIVFIFLFSCFLVVLFSCQSSEYLRLFSQPPVCLGAGSGAMLGAAAAALESDWIRAMVAERGSTYCEFMMPGSKTREEKFLKKALPTALIAGRRLFS